MITCSKCGNRNRDIAKFCGYCGYEFPWAKQEHKKFEPPDQGNEQGGITSEIDKTKKCTYCAETIKANASTCQYCGRNLTTLTPHGKDGRRLTGWQIGLIVVLVLAILTLAITNPSEKIHNQAIYSHVGKVAGQALAGDIGGLVGRLLGGAVGNLVNSIDLTIFEYNNYILFSTTEFNDEIITFGILGNVRIITPVEEWIEDIPGIISDFPTLPKPELPSASDQDTPNITPTPTTKPKFTPMVKTQMPLPTGYIIVVSAFGHFDKAVRWETEKFKGISPMVIYFRKDLYRNAIHGFRSEVECMNGLLQAQKINPNSYCRDLSMWCPNPVRTSNYIECK